MQEAPIEHWPPCDALIAFHSGKFPLAKAIAYAKLHQPVQINDLEVQVCGVMRSACTHRGQEELLSRASMYRRLVLSGVPTSPHWIVNHLDPAQEALFEEYDDYVVINGTTLAKPFVEKPVSLCRRIARLLLRLHVIWCLCVHAGEQ